MPGFLADLTVGQRQLLAALSALVLLLGLAAGAVALGDDDPRDQAVQTADDGTSTSAGAGSSSSSSTSSTSTSVPPDRDGDGDDDDDDADDDGSSGGPSTTVRRGSATTARSTATTRAGSPRSSSSTAPPAAQPPGGSGCTTGGSSGDGGAAAQIASRYCQHRSANGAEERMERSSRLDAAAQDWAEHLADTGELGHDPNLDRNVRSACGAGCVPGENVAWQQPPDLGAVWTRWLGSPDHRRNLDRADGGIYGTGSALSADGRMYYVHVFGWT